jgi:hypothetical protein
MNTSEYSLNTFDAMLLTLPQSYVATIISVFELAPPPPSRAQQNSISAVLNKCRSVFCFFLIARAAAFFATLSLLTSQSHLHKNATDYWFNRAKEVTSDAPGDSSANTIPPAAADASAAVSAASTKRSRDDEPAVAGGAVSRQKQGDGTGWDGVRVHRVGATGCWFQICALCCICDVLACLLMPLRSLQRMVAPAVLFCNFTAQGVLFLKNSL